MQRTTYRALFLSLLATALFTLPLFAQLRPFPQHVTYAGATIYPNNRTQAQKDDDVRTYYNWWKSQYLVTAGTAADGSQLYRIAMGGPGSDDAYRTTSESQGYGMTIVALMAGHETNAKQIFDGLWKFTRLHPSSIDSRLMAWEVPETPGDNDSAFDGDADMAYALLMADKQWGSAGAINYLSAATTLIAGIKASTIGPNSRLPMLGDWVTYNGSTRNEYTPRTSDFMLANFRAYRNATADVTWDTVVTNSQSAITHLQTNYASTTGLLPDFTERTSSTSTTMMPASPYFLEDYTDGDYSYNACRVPWRLGLHALLWNNATSVTQVQKISSWAKTKTAGNPQIFREPGYMLDGTTLEPTWDYSSAFVAPLGVAAMSGGSTQQTWLNSIYSSVVARHEGYYADSIDMICLIIMSGNHWDPTL
ncbi:MAG: glycosyl hydrolase family 8 [Acidobacteriota bacterium]|nr:glycosyl hydrolase family 8 [Acidobacteriota bacterium]